jgi:hypothetical protein
MVGFSWFFLEDVSPLSALVGALAVIFVLDELIKVLVVGRGAEDKGQRWFFLHAAANVFVVVWGIKDCITTLDNPSDAMSQHHKWSSIPGGFVAAIHTYHVLRFKLGSGDIFHHVAFAGVGCFSNYIVNYGPLANLYFFFVCGLPGCVLGAANRSTANRSTALHPSTPPLTVLTSHHSSPSSPPSGIDYFLLGLVKCGRLAALEEKRLNSAINLWLRGEDSRLLEPRQSPDRAQSEPRRPRNSHSLSLSAAHTNGTNGTNETPPRAPSPFSFLQGRG